MDARLRRRAALRRVRPFLSTCGRHHEETYLDDTARARRIDGERGYALDRVVRLQPDLQALQPELAGTVAVGRGTPTGVRADESGAMGNRAVRAARGGLPHPGHQSTVVSGQELHCPAAAVVLR